MTTNNATQLPMFDYLEIRLKNGSIVLIDPVDTDLLESRWHYATVGYAVRNIWTGKKSVQYMHRIIASRIAERQLDSSDEVDHIDGNKLNNRRSNLRIGTHTQNTWNMRKSKANTSGYKGVVWSSQRQKWQAKILVNGKCIHLGFFADPAEAYKVRCEAAIKYHGEFARFE